MGHRTFFAPLGGEPHTIFVCFNDFRNAVRQFVYQPYLLGTQGLCQNRGTRHGGVHAAAGGDQFCHPCCVAGIRRGLFRVSRLLLPNPAVFPLPVQHQDHPVGDVSVLVLHHTDLPLLQIPGPVLSGSCGDHRHADHPDGDVSADPAILSAAAARKTALCYRP